MILSKTNKYLNTQETLELLRISESTLRRWKKQGIIPYHMLGGKCFYDEQEIHQAIKNTNNVNN